MSDLKYSRGYYSNTSNGQLEYEKQWENDEQCAPCKVRTDYSNWTPVSEYPKSFNN